MGKKLKGIRAVLFDIDDTLFPSRKFSSRARRNAILAMIAAGMDAREEEALAAHKKIVEKYGPNFGRHFNLLAKKFPCENKERAIAAGIVAYHDAKRSIRPFPKAAHTLSKLRARGYLLCIASEGKPIKQWDKLIRLRLHSLFSHAFITAKKSPAYYLACAKKLCLSPQECLMVGNHVQKDSTFAKRAKMNALLIGGGKKSPRSIRNLQQLLSLLP